MNDSPPSPSPNIRGRIFVVGVPRSGTTLVQSLLASHDLVASWTESHFFADHFRIVPGLPDRALLVRDPMPSVCQFLRTNGLSDEGRGTPWFTDPDGRPRFYRQLMPMRSAWASRTFLTMLDELALQQGCAMWVEKTPAHLRFVPFLERIAEGFVDLRFVHVIREGVATVTSLYRASAHWPRRFTVPECIALWNKDVAFSLARAQTSKDVFVFYEDLLQTPEATVKGLLEEFDLTWQPNLFDRRAETADRLTAPNELAWKADFARTIGPSQRQDDGLTDALRQRIESSLDRDLYARLRDQIAQRRSQRDEPKPS